MYQKIITNTENNKNSGDNEHFFLSLATILLIFGGCFSGVYHLLVSGDELLREHFNFAPEGFYKYLYTGFKYFSGALLSVAVLPLVDKFSEKILDALNGYNKISLNDKR